MYLNTHKNSNYKKLLLLFSGLKAVISLYSYCYDMLLDILTFLLNRTYFLITNIVAKVF